MKQKNYILIVQKQKNLDWTTKRDTKKSINMTTEWYKEYYINPAKSYEITLNQLNQWRKSVLNKAFSKISYVI